MCAVLSQSRHINKDHAAKSRLLHASVWRYSKTGHAGFHRDGNAVFIPHSGKPEPWRKNQAHNVFRKAPVVVLLLDHIRKR